MAEMKAWRATDPDCERVAIVFAETAGKAKRYCCDYVDAIGEVGFIDVSVRRCKEADKFYRGEPQMYWYDDDDRTLMIKELGFYCSDEAYDARKCLMCRDKDYCSRYIENGG